tara:strand:+ start:163 stop:357 length:195 start_codon:yes stop_codon:yes gene_type:complete
LVRGWTRRGLGVLTLVLLRLGFVEDMKLWILPQDKAGFLVVDLCFDSLVISIVCPYGLAEIAEE